MTTRLISTVALISGMCGGLQAASTPLIVSPGTGDASFEHQGVTAGNRFVVGAQPLSVTSLGLFDWGTPGFAQSHSVGLWSDAGTLLARADFSPGLSGTAENGFFYQPLTTPVTLQPGMNYIMAASYLNADVDRFLANDVFSAETYAPQVTFLNGRYSVPDAGFVFPNLDVYNASYVGANLQFVAVPEPGVTALLMLGAGAWGLGKLRRKQSGSPAP
jgi:hypothetical protein